MIPINELPSFHPCIISAVDLYTIMIQRRDFSNDALFASRLCLKEGSRRRCKVRRRNNNNMMLHGRLSWCPQQNSNLTFSAPLNVGPFLSHDPRSGPNGLFFVLRYDMRSERNGFSLFDDTKWLPEQCRIVDCQMKFRMLMGMGVRRT